MTTSAVAPATDLRPPSVSLRNGWYVFDLPWRPVPSDGTVQSRLIAGNRGVPNPTHLPKFGTVRLSAYVWAVNPASRLKYSNNGRAVRGPIAFRRVKDAAGERLLLRVPEAGLVAADDPWTDPVFSVLGFVPGFRYERDLVEVAVRCYRPEETLRRTGVLNYDGRGSGGGFANE